MIFVMQCFRFVVLHCDLQSSVLQFGIAFFVYFVDGSQAAKPYLQVVVMVPVVHIILFVIS